MSNLNQVRDAMNEILYGGSFHEWEFYDNPREHNVCHSCGWDSSKRDRSKGLTHFHGCELRKAIDIVEEFMGVE